MANLFGHLPALLLRHQLGKRELLAKVTLSELVFAWGMLVVTFLHSSSGAILQVSSGT